jgi:Zn-dependent protease/CBS domain-containing protein
MTWSLPLGSIAGIRLQVHFTFLALLAWMTVSGWLKGDLSGVPFFLGLFLCVLLHELGHALMAKHYGILTKDITLLPIGGVARLERMPEDPRQELWVALAGPAVNVVIAAILYGIVGGFTPRAETIGSGPLLERLLLANITLVVFNMLPAFPMDGGRVLRALLATRMEYTKATQTAATIGQVMAVLFGFVGFFTNPFLIFIALFVWIGAGQEASMVQMKSALGGIPVRAAMLTDFQVIGVNDNLDRAVELILAGSQMDFPVLDGASVVGVLTRDDLLQALARKEERGVRDVMRTDIQPAEAGEMLEGALQRLQQCACRTMPVMQGGRLVGLLTMDNVGEFLTIQAAVGKRALRTLPVLLLVGLVACGGGKQAAAPDQALAYADARSCAPCHPQQAKPYALTGMGRSFKKATAADAPAGDVCT